MCSSIRIEPSQDLLRDENNRVWKACKKKIYKFDFEIDSKYVLIFTSLLRTNREITIK